MLVFVFGFLRSKSSSMMRILYLGATVNPSKLVFVFEFVFFCVFVFGFLCSKRSIRSSMRRILWLQATVNPSKLVEPLSQERSLPYLLPANAQAISMYLYLYFHLYLYLYLYLFFCAAREIPSIFATSNCTSNTKMVNIVE